MGKLVARLLGKSELSVKDGRVDLTEAEREKVRTNFGGEFLARLDASALSDEDDALELFNAAVESKTADLTARLSEKDGLVKELQTTIAKLMDEPEPAPSAQHLKQQAGALSLNLSARHNKIAAAALEGTNPYAFAQTAAAGNLDVTELNAEFTLAMPPKMRLEILTKRLYAGFSDSKHMTRVQSNTDYIATDAIMTEVSQQFTPAWTPKGNAKFTPLRIPYRRHKINVSIKPAEIIPSWLLYMYEQGKTLAQMPVTHYIINEHILPKLLEDITTSMISKGKFVDAGIKNDGDTAPAAKDSMDGFETILAEGRKNPKCKMNFYKDAVNPYTLGDAELLKYIQGFVDSISPLFAGKMDIHCAPELLTLYQRADFAVNGKYTGELVGGKVRFTNFNLIPMDSMYRSQILFATPKSNFVELVDYSAPDKCIQKINEYDYDLHVIGEYSLSVGFKVQEAVYAAVPDGYDPTAAIVTDPASYSDKWTNGTAPVTEPTVEEGA